MKPKEKLRLFVKLLFELSRDWSPEQAGYVMVVCLQNMNRELGLK